MPYLNVALVGKNDTSAVKDFFQSATDRQAPSMRRVSFLTFLSDSCAEHGSVPCKWWKLINV